MPSKYNTSKTIEFINAAGSPRLVRPDAYFIDESPAAYSGK
jgi:hypothetical protein